MKKILFPVLVAMLLLVSAVAWAAGFDPMDPTSGISTALDALIHGDWWIVAAFGTTVAVWVLRKWVLGKGVFGTKWGGWALNALLSMLVVGIAFLSGSDHTLPVLWLAAKAWLRDFAVAGLSYHFASDVKAQVTAAEPPK